jgi:hypothetical protein
MNSVRGNGLPPKTSSPTATISITQDEILVMLIPHCDLQVKFSGFVRRVSARAATYIFLSKVGSQAGYRWLLSHCPNPGGIRLGLPQPWAVPMSSVSQRQCEGS